MNRSIPKNVLNLARLFFGPPKPTLRIMVGDKKTILSSNLTCCQHTHCYTCANMHSNMPANICVNMHSDMLANMRGNVHARSCAYLGGHTCPNIYNLLQLLFYHAFLISDFKKSGQLVAAFNQHGSKVGILNLH